MGEFESGMRRDSGRRLTRRRFVGGAVLLSGGTLLAACGATTTPPTGAILASTPAASTAATGVVGVPATATRATPPAGTPTRTAPSAAATRTVVGAAATELGRLLGLVPQTGELPGRNGIWFADAVRQKRNYGFEGVISPDAARAVPGGLTRFTNTVGSLPFPNEVGLEHAADPRWRATLGYDFWQIERTISGGDLPRVWGRMEGRFDRAAIETTLLGQGYVTTPYRERTYLSRLGDAEIKRDDPLSQLVFSRLNRAVIEEGALGNAATTATIEAGIDAATGRRPTFAADPDYAALALALGSVVGAVLLPADEIYRSPAPARATTAVATRYVAPAHPRLSPYRLVGLGLRDDGATHTMVVALVYGDAAEAQAAAPILRQRAEDYTLVRTGQRLRERALPGEPEVVAAGGRAVLVQPFAIAAEADLSLYLKMYNTLDLLFLAE